MRSMKSYKLLTVVVFAFLLTCASAPAQTFQVLYTFHGPDGAAPDGPLTLDSTGNIYGTTLIGGNGNCERGPGCGTVFALNKSGKMLGSYSFNGADGVYPSGGLLRDSAGNIFGITRGGGDYSQNCGGAQGDGCGVVFKLTPKGKETFYKFTGSGPWYPTGNLVQDADGNLYGTTNSSRRVWGGTVYKLDQTGKLTVLQDIPTGKCGVEGLIILDNNLYGSVVGYLCTHTLTFQMTTDGSYTAIGNGRNYVANSVLAADSEGNLYGTTGNNVDSGTVFKLSPNGNGGWNQTTLYTFCQKGCVDGSEPNGPLVVDAAGNIYGVTSGGGDSQLCNGGCGVVFKLDPKGNETVLYDFTDESDGAFPSSGLTMDSAGNLYGVAAEGGDFLCPDELGGVGCGTVFRITP